MRSSSKPNYGPSHRADRFVERWQKLEASQRQYQAGDMSGYKSTRAAMGDMAKSLQRDPQLESLLANRGIRGNFGLGGHAAMPEPDRIIRLKTVLGRTGLSRSTIYCKIAEGAFPSQINISVNGTGWHESDINRWIADPVLWRLTLPPQFNPGRTGPCLQRSGTTAAVPRQVGL